MTASLFDVTPQSSEARHCPCCLTPIGAPTRPHPDVPFCCMNYVGWHRDPARWHQRCPGDSPVSRSTSRHEPRTSAYGHVLVTDYKAEPSEPEGCASVEERDAGLVFAWCAAGMLAAGLGFALAVAGGWIE